MKKLLLIFLLAISATAQAQKLRFTDPGNHWITMGYVSFTSFGQYFGLGADTVMYLHTYKPMLDTSYYAYGSSEYHYWVREDTIANIVYYREPEMDTLEHRLYDYNLQLGDTIQFTNGAYVSYDSVAGLDSVLLRGVYHKIFTMQGNPSGRAYTMIEGIGATNSPVWPSFFTSGPEYTEELLCFREDTFMPSLVTPYYMYAGAEGPDSFRNGAEDCYPLSVAKPEKTPLQLYPNPATATLTISAPQIITSVSIANLFGQTVYTHAYNREKVEVAISALPCGVYFVMVAGPDGHQQEVRKFLKE